MAVSLRPCVYGRNGSFTTIGQAVQFGAQFELQHVKAEIVVIVNLNRGMSSVTTRGYGNASFMCSRVGFA